MGDRPTGILARILAEKQRELEGMRRAVPLANLEREAAHMSAPRGMTRALTRASLQPVRVIAEIKRASPSAGAIRPGADPAVIARAYEQAGAAAISVLTDRAFFDGDVAFLGTVREVVSVPLLRKDFILDAYQVVEARARGADAVLLIAAALERAQLAELVCAIEAWGMDALVEVHDEAEAETAVACGATLIGVNHRNLSTFAIDLGLTGRLAHRLPAHIVLVAESGIRSASDVRMLGAAGAHAVLVGESLMRAGSPGDAARALCGHIPEAG